MSRFELVELGLAHDLVQAGLELVGERADLADPHRRRAHRLRQVLGSDDHDGDQGDDRQL